MSPKWNRLVRFEAREDGKTYFGEPISKDASDDVGLLEPQSALKAKVIKGDPLTDGNVTNEVLTVKTLLSPLAPSQIPSIRCLGANFGPDPTKRPILPILFFKPPTSLSGPYDPIPIPEHLQDESDFEAELVVVIGKKCKDVGVEEALDSVLGYTLCNDVSGRKSMAAVSQCALGKAFDGWLPLGPCIVSADLIKDPQDVRLRTHVNGQLMQASTLISLSTIPSGLRMTPSFIPPQDESTAKQLYTVAETISILSRGNTLQPGDIIATGSPDGFGAMRNPPVWLKHGDEVRISGDRGLGTLINGVVFEGVSKVQPKL